MDDEKLLLLSAECARLYDTHNHPECAKRYTEMCKLAEKNGNQRAVIEARVRIAEACSYLRQIDFALSHLDVAEPIALRICGPDSDAMLELLKIRVLVLSNGKRLAESYKCADRLLEVTEKRFGRGENYIDCLFSLADITFGSRDAAGILKFVELARPYLENHKLQPRFLNLEALALKELCRFQEAVEVREREIALCLKIFGANNPQYATSLTNAAVLYRELKQVERAIPLIREAVGIYERTIGPTHWDTMTARLELSNLEKALHDQAEQRKLAAPSHRMCSISGCNAVKEKMNRYLSFYLCKKHEGKINEHVSVCPKFPDVLPDEEKGKKIVRCRRCRKEAKLMKCGRCGNVWYCGAECQKDDWKRHKLFCGKK